MKRSERRKKKRKGLRRFLIAMVSLFVIGIAYWVIQYNQGLSIGGKEATKDEVYDPFEGAEPIFGEINVLLLGSDARGDEKARADTLMIAHYNQTTNDVRLVSIMRDIYVEIPGYGKQKMNTAFAIGGPELVRKTIKENLDIDVHYYAIVDFTGFSKIVDVIAPEGIEVDIPYTMSHGIYMTLHPGTQMLNGEQLLGYVRFRHDRLSDFGRVERQQEALMKLKDQAISFHTFMNLPKLLGVVEPYIDTNVDNRTLLSIGKGMLLNKEASMETLRIPVAHSYVPKRKRVGDVLSIDFEQNKQALKEFLSPGEDDKPFESYEATP